ncbi:MAG: alpha/beta hydrolase [Pseudomonadales bacterium]|nr:alpha/beta hydrolase [Pseudomonadales bacterium]
MSGFFFGESTKPKFGFYHAPAGYASTAVLFCAPICQEYLRTHRLLAQLARYLASENYAVLRFDYSGLGDSWGDLLQTNVNTWLKDTEDAIEELLALSGAQELVLLGVRFGATICSKLSARTDFASHSICIDPVFSGADYVGHLRDMNYKLLTDSNIFLYKRTEVRPPDANEILGYRMGDELLDQISESNFEFAPNQSLLISEKYVDANEFKALGDKSHLPLNSLSENCYWHSSSHIEQQVILPTLNQLVLDQLINRFSC